MQTGERRAKPLFKMPVRSKKIALPNYVASGQKWHKGIVVWESVDRRSRSKGRDAECYVLKYTFKTKPPLVNPTLPWLLVLFSPPQHSHTLTHTLTPPTMTLADHSQEFWGSSVYWEVSEKQSLVTEKHRREGKAICMLQLNGNDAQESHH